MGGGNALGIGSEGAKKEGWKTPDVRRTLHQLLPHHQQLSDHTQYIEVDSKSEEEAARDLQHSINQTVRDFVMPLGTWDEDQLEARQGGLTYSQSFKT